MATIDDLVSTLESVRRDLVDLPLRMRVTAAQIQTGTLADISEDMGLLTRGEFRTYGNGKLPGEGYSGVRMASPGAWYEDKYWDLSLIENDGLLWGLSREGGIEMRLGNGLPLNQGFSGIRMAYPPIVYNGDSYAFLTYDSDGAMQLGIGVDGKLSAGGDKVSLDKNGITILASTGYAAGAAIKFISSDLSRIVAYINVIEDSENSIIYVDAGRLSTGSTKSSRVGINANGAESLVSISAIGSYPIPVIADINISTPPASTGLSTGFSAIGFRTSRHGGIGTYGYTLEGGALLLPIVATSDFWSGNAQQRCLETDGTRLYFETTLYGTFSALAFSSEVPASSDYTYTAGSRLALSTGKSFSVVGSDVDYVAGTAIAISTGRMISVISSDITIPLSTGATYTAGSGIAISTGRVISVSSDVIMSSDLVYPDGYSGNGAAFVGYTAAGAIIADNAISVVATATVGGVTLISSAASAADGVYYILNVPLRAGTYSIAINYVKSTAYGKFDMYMDGTKVSGATPLDCYAASTSYNNQWDVTGVVVATSGWHELKILTNGKNASSSDYRIYIGPVVIHRTAA